MFGFIVPRAWVSLLAHKLREQDKMQRAGENASICHFHRPISELCGRWIEFLGHYVRGVPYVAHSSSIPWIGGFALLDDSHRHSVIPSTCCNALHIACSCCSFLLYRCFAAFHSCDEKGYTHFAIVQHLAKPRWLPMSNSQVCSWVSILKACVCNSLGAVGQGCACILWIIYDPVLSVFTSHPCVVKMNHQHKTAPLKLERLWD